MMFTIQSNVFDVRAFLRRGMAPVVRDVLPNLGVMCTPCIDGYGTAAYPFLGRFDTQLDRSITARRKGATILETTHGPVTLLDPPATGAVTCAGLGLRGAMPSGSGSGRTYRYADHGLSFRYQCVKKTDVEGLVDAVDVSHLLGEELIVVPDLIKGLSRPDHRRLIRTAAVHVYGDLVFQRYRGPFSHTLATLLELGVACREDGIDGWMELFARHYPRKLGDVWQGLAIAEQVLDDPAPMVKPVDSFPDDPSVQAAYHLVETARAMLPSLRETIERVMMVHGLLPPAPDDLTEGDFRCCLIPCLQLAPDAAVDWYLSNRTTIKEPYWDLAGKYGAEYLSEPLLTQWALLGGLEGEKVIAFIAEIGLVQDLRIEVEVVCASLGIALDNDLGRRWCERLVLRTHLTYPELLDFSTRDRWLEEGQGRLRRLVEACGLKSPSPTPGAGLSCAGIIHSLLHEPTDWVCVPVVVSPYLIGAIINDCLKEIEAWIANFEMWRQHHPLSERELDLEKKEFVLFCCRAYREHFLQYYPPSVVNLAPLRRSIDLALRARLRRIGNRDLPSVFRGEDPILDDF